MCFIWDRVFGTFRELTEHRPDVGLEGRPHLHMNPVRLAFAGCAQLIYELKHNTSFPGRLKLLFMGTDYVPQHSRDFAVKS